MTRFRSTFAVAALALALGLAGCGSDAGTSDATRSPAPPAVPSVTASTPAYDPLPWSVADGPMDRCGPQPQRVVDQGFRPITVRDPGNASLPAVVTGRGATVAVLLHQTDGNGYCGWLAFAQEIAKEPGVTVLAPDLCGYGEARCDPDYSSGQPVAQVRLAIDYAERELGARRVVLVGASMGGTLAVLTAARDPRVDALVDLSGPEEWGEPAVSTAARRLTAPALVATATDEGPDEVAAARAAAAAAPTGSVFVEATEGHGYVLLAEPDGRPTRLAEQVLAWIREA